ncbi:hypothetical protein [Streptomyces nitrosporeus]|uniref:hypothetical protein n=1 Tax=Streptomyces nitrosporeus TaxID=28894 RepID=UPI00167D3629|nr:hypothetical protein [Streptomyces nitrosporeus]GGZ12951.1 hypothetical protein GCM10010327_50060 [Streptomyces nitrosporeus]
MTDSRRVRRLVAGEETWFWSVSHRHPECREVLSLRREGGPTALRIVFREGPGRIVSGGYAWHDGLVGTAHGPDLNLHEPGVVRRLLDEAKARGLVREGRSDPEADGWPLLDAVAEGRAPE